MKPQLKEINLHITDVCSAKCPMCYQTSENTPKIHGNLETLKIIVKNAIKNGHVERFVMVGGDPCAHPNFVELLKHVKEIGNQYNINPKTIVLSNTHDYKENGKLVDIKYTSQYIDEIDVTIHGATAEKHNSFNRCPGSYEHVMKNIQRFADIKNQNQEICAVINLMPYTMIHIEEIMTNTIKNSGGNINSFMIQRIGFAGKACEAPQKWVVGAQDINPFMSVCDKMNKNGYPVVFCDVLPWCSVKEEYRYLLPEGGCNWGYDTCAVFMDGSVKRCALGTNNLSKNITQLDTPEKFINWWQNDTELTQFRKKCHLDVRCKSCDLLAKCGGGCVLARLEGDPYKKTDITVDFARAPFVWGEAKSLPLGHDYLAKGLSR